MRRGKKLGIFSIVILVIIILIIVILMKNDANNSANTGWWNQPFNASEAYQPLPPKGISVIIPSGNYSGNVIWSYNNATGYIRIYTCWQCDNFAVVGVAQNQEIEISPIYGVAENSSLLLQLNNTIHLYKVKQNGTIVLFHPFPS